MFNFVEYIKFLYLARVAITRAHGHEDPELMAVFLIESPFTVSFIVILLYLNFNVHPIPVTAMAIMVFIFVSVITFSLKDFFNKVMRDNDLIIKFNNFSKIKKKSLSDTVVLIGFISGAFFYLSGLAMTDII